MRYCSSALEMFWSSLVFGEGVVSVVAGDMDTMLVALRTPFAVRSTNLVRQPSSSESSPSRSVRASAGARAIASTARWRRRISQRRFWLIRLLVRLSTSCVYTPMTWSRCARQKDASSLCGSARITVAMVTALLKAWYHMNQWRAETCGCAAYCAHASWIRTFG